MPDGLVPAHRRLPGSADSAARAGQAHRQPFPSAQHGYTDPARVRRFCKFAPERNGSWVQSVQPAGAGSTAGMLGFMFWAAECQGSGTCTTPPNTCEGGMGVAAKTFNIPLPMPPLRQQ